MSFLSQEERAQIELWRRKAVDGTLTIEEMRQAVSIMRQGRIGASAASAKSRTAPKAPVNIDDLLGDLENL